MNEKRNKITLFIRLSALTMILIMALISLTACKTNIEKYDGVISEIRDNYFVAQNESISAVAVTGSREDPFAIDGSTSPKKEFTILTITPKVYNQADRYNYKIMLNGQEFTGNFVPHPFANSWSAEISVVATEQFNLTLSGTASAELTLSSVKSADMINSDKAFDIALTRLKKSLKSFNGESYEVYIRFVANPISNAGGYFWYVAFVNPQITCAVLIEPVSMEIIAVRD